MINNNFKQGKSSAKKNIILVLGIILIAFNLRPALTAVGPVASFIRADMSLSNTAVGLITTLPLVTFAFFSPLVPRIAYRLGNESTLFLGLLLLMGGILIRSVEMLCVLYIGTVLVGLGIAICNVLLPALIKDKYPQRVGLMTSIYATAMVIFAAIASGISVPLAEGLNLGWQGALAFWAILAALAIVVWLPQVSLQTNLNPVKQLGVQTLQRELWRSPLAWQVTFFMGLQSLSFYVTVAWLPEILYSYGLDLTLAGWLLSLVQFISIPATFVAPLFADRFRNQQKLFLLIGCLYVAGLGGLIFFRDVFMLAFSIMVLGLGQGASISLVFTLFALRTVNAQQAAELSGMAQSIGYLLAAIGPMIIGWMFDLTHAWVLPLISLIVVAMLMTLAGFGAGRNRYVLPGDNPALEDIE